MDGITKPRELSDEEVCAPGKGEGAMSEEKTALARRAVACPGWMWMPGMKIANGPRVIGDDPIEPDDTPDFDDPPTMGWLLALVREALGDPTAYVGHAGDRSITPWWLMAPEPMTRAATEAEALVAALEAAGDKAERGR